MEIRDIAFILKRLDEGYALLERETLEVKKYAHILSKLLLVMSKSYIKLKRDYVQVLNELCELKRANITIPWWEWKDKGDRILIRGLVLNVGRETAKDVRLVIRIYDKDGELIGLGVAFLGSLRGETLAMFELEVDYRDHYSAYKVRLSWSWK